MYEASLTIVRPLNCFGNCETSGLHLRWTGFYLAPESHAAARLKLDL
jgi:hypothetical protein